MKAIMISIRPEWVAKILNGEKTLEIRKTFPKCDLPIEVYIYCTKGKPYLTYYRGACRNEYITHNDKKGLLLNGKVVAKFTLKKVEKIKEDERCGLLWSQTMIEETLLKASCLTQEELYDYLSMSIGCDNDGWVYGYAWQIDNLEIFDKPKELSDFKKNGWNCEHCFNISTCCMSKLCAVEKPPQSWCYVEV